MSTGLLIVDALNSNNSIQAHLTWPLSKGSGLALGYASSLSEATATGNLTAPNIYAKSNIKARISLYKELTEGNIHLF